MHLSSHKRYITNAHTSPKCVIDNSQIVTYLPPSNDKQSAKIADHELASFAHIAAKIATLTGLKFEGQYDPERIYDRHAPYFVPIDTLLLAQANKLGIRDESQLFGGCVPHPFVATKSISHDLISTGAAAPFGWSPQFAESIADVVLPGYSAFSKRDALAAAEKLLLRGDIRIKTPLGRGGSGQCVAADSRQAHAALALIDDTACEHYGIVLEQNLAEVTTSSIGTIKIGDRQISYCGVQYLIDNSHGHSVYGGSSLRAVRGNFSALLRCDLSDIERLAIIKANTYDTAALHYFSGFFASRRNYDVAFGVGPDNEMCSGVLEQSWRIGGASPAEIAAFEALLDDDLFSVRASCREIYALCEVPPDAYLYFRGEDARVGAITKYSTIDAREYLPS